VFGRSNDPQSVTPATVQSTPAPDGKGRPTPKRKEAEAANKRPLVPTDRKAAGKTGRAQAKEQRDREYRAMQTGDERFMPAKDRGPLRRFVRDWVDARWNLGELILPAAAVLLVVQLTLSKAAPVLAALAILVLYVFVLAAIIDSWIMWRGLKKALVAKFGKDAPPKGTVSYAVIRTFQIRPSRMPKPQVKHGQRPS